MIALVIILLAVCLGLPLFYAWRIWRLNEPSALSWLLVVTDACVFVALIMLLGRWDITGFYVRFALLALVAAAVIRSLARHARRAWAPPNLKVFLQTRVPTIVSLVAFSAALAYVVSGLFPPARTIDLTFPLRDGRFIVGQGGGVMLLNRHADHEEQRFAADITAIGPEGFRAGGILPRELDSYEIFGKQVVAPCDGSVMSTGDGLPDLPPPEADRENPAGNHVVLLCGGSQVELAHLQRGSIRVSPSDDVRVGDLMGLVGNSGNTTETHLHIHAVDPDTGAGVPITFDGHFPVRNRLYSY